MGRMNERRVLAGGLAAGLILFAGSLLLRALSGYETAAALFVPAADVFVDGLELGFYLIFHLALAVPMVWLYAAMRPRYGAGPRTAVRAGFVAWWLAFLMQLPFRGVARSYDSGEIGGTVIAMMAASAVLFLLAALVGARIYREEEPAPAASPALAAEP